MPKSKTDGPNFEKDLEGLETIVSALEEGGLSLDDALKRFEEGVRLARRCEKALTEAEKKIEVLLKNADGELEAKPFDADAKEEAAPPSAAPAPVEDDGPPLEEPPEEDDDELLF